MLFGAGHIGRQMVSAKKLGPIAPDANSPTIVLDLMTPGTLDPAWTFMRASTNGTYFDNNGVMQNAPVNLVLQSGTMSVAPWTVTRSTVAAGATVAPDGTMSGVQIIEDTSASTTHLLQQIVAGVAANAAFTGSVFIKANTRQFVQFQMIDQTTQANFIAVNVDLLAGNVGAAILGGAASGGVAAIRGVGGGWYRVSLTATLSAAATTGIILRVLPCAVLGSANYTGDGVSGIYAWGAQLETGTIATPLITTTTLAAGGPRWDYDPSTQQLNGLLLEEARTNNALQSGDFTNAVWVKGGCTLAAGTLGPNGAVTGFGLIANAGATGYLGSGNLTPAAGTTYTLSCFIKAGSHTSALFLMPAAWFADALIRTVTFNLATGIVSAVGGVTASGAITPAGNGWYRCSITATPDTAALGGYQIARTMTVGDGVALQYYVWGAQFEVGSYVTSYIPTTTVAVTRARDSLSITAPGTWYDVTKGSMSFEHIPRGAGSFSSPAQLVGAATGTDFIDCVGYTTAGTVPGVSYGLGTHTQKVGGVTQVQAGFGGATSVAINAMHRHAVSWALGNGARAAVDGVNGVPGNPPAPAALPTITSLTLAGIANSQPQVSLWARKFQYWPRQLSQNELTLVSIGAM